MKEERESSHDLRLKNETRERRENRGKKKDESGQGKEKVGR